MAHAPVAEGDVLAGKYCVERLLGAGNMGVVVAARHVQLGQRVALKFLLPEAMRHPEAIERFLREGMAVVRIESEHVARVTDLGTLADGAPFIVMEYLDGQDLARLLEARGRLSVADAVAYVLQACEALAEAHELGIVHRDLKPANLFLTRRRDGSVLIKVLDFGISKLQSAGHDGASAAVVTATATVMGSPMYMSPEQIRSSKNVDARTDIWSIGVILHQLLTGRTVFESDTVPGLLARIVADPPAALRDHWSEAPPELERVILRCLEKDPARRVSTLAELATLLLPFAPPDARSSVDRILRLQLAVAPLTPAPVEAPAVQLSSGTELRTAPAWTATRNGNARRNPRRIVVIGMGALASLAGAGVWAWSHTSEHDVAAAAASAAPLPVIASRPEPTPSARDRDAPTPPPSAALPSDAAMPSALAPSAAATPSALAPSVSSVPFVRRKHDTAQPARTDAKPPATAPLSPAASAPAHASTSRPPSAFDDRR